MTNEEYNQRQWGIFDGLVIYRGSPVNLTLYLKNPDGTSVDLTNLEPFTCNVARNAEGPSLIAPTVAVEGDPEDGVLLITATAAETADLQVCEPEWAVKDKTGYRWVGGTGKIRKSA